MTKTKLTVIKVTEEKIAEKVYTIRGVKVMLDKDLAEMYGVEVKVLNQAVKRKIQRFPDDFMFQLSNHEWKNLKSQIVTSSWGGTRKLPYVFTEQGVAMLSSVLNSDIAVEVNIQIIRVFTKMRQAILDNKEILARIDKMEKKLTQHDEELQTVFKALKKLLQQPEPVKRKSIGFPYPNKK